MPKGWHAVMVLGLCVNAVFFQLGAFNQKPASTGAVVCMFGMLRGLNATADRIVQNLLAPTNADLVVYAPSVGSVDKTPYSNHKLLQRATLVRFGEESEVVLMDKEKQDALGFPPGNWYGWTGLKQMWGMKQCGKLIAKAETERGRSYRWVIFTRPDIYWECKHPPLHCFDDQFVWAPTGESYGGVNDRHVIIPRNSVHSFINRFDEVQSGALEFGLARARKDTRLRFGAEQFHAFHMRANGLQVGRYDAGYFLTCGSMSEYHELGFRTRWDGRKNKTACKLDSSKNRVFKYRNEYELAQRICSTTEPPRAPSGGGCDNFNAEVVNLDSR